MKKKINYNEKKMEKKKNFVQKNLEWATAHLYCKKKKIVLQASELGIVLQHTDCILTGCRLDERLYRNRG